MRTVEITLYHYDELPTEKAKEKAREWWLQDGLGYDWWDAVYEDADQVAQILGIEIDRKGKSTPAIYFTGFYHPGEGSSFEGHYAYAKGAVKAIKAYAPRDETLHRIARDLQEAQRRNFYGLRATIRAYRDSSIHVNVENIQHIYGDATDEAEEAITEAMNDFNHWLFQRLKDEYEYLTSDEQVEESIRANEYEFTEEGHPA